jgi:hypothetical protein
MFSCPFASRALRTVGQMGQFPSSGCAKRMMIIKDDNKGLKKKDYDKG